MEARVIVRRTLLLAVAALSVLTVSRSVSSDDTHATPNVPAPQKGDVIAPFSADAVDGSKKSFTFPAKGPSRVFLFFLPSCGTCHRMIPEWNRAYERRPKGLEVVGVMMEPEPPGFFQSYPISFPVVRAPGGREWAKVMKINRVPVTMRVGPGGKIEDAKVGIVDPIALGDIFRP